MNKLSVCDADIGQCCVGFVCERKHVHELTVMSPLLGR